MVHIVDGVLSVPVLATGAVAGTIGVAVGLRHIPPERLPQVGLMSAALFVGSLVHVPLGPSSVHLLLNGLAGLVLGWAAFPAIFVALVLQAVFFGYGGVTVLGVNTVVIAMPAILCHYAFRRAVHRQQEAFVWGAAAGATAVILTALAVGAALAASGREFLAAAQLVLVSHVPVLVVEAAVTGAVVSLLQKVRPEAFAFAPQAVVTGNG